ncbi:hypothetical protein ACWCPT_26285 [Streptomyces sp. NPDC002308]
MRFLLRRPARRTAVAASALVLCTGGLVVGGASPSHAAAAVCAGTKIDTLEFYTGYSYLFYNSATGLNCAYTVPKSGGVRQFMAVGLFRESDGAGVWDDGDYVQYAGPVYLYAPGTCVSFNGQVGSWAGNSGAGHCGALAAASPGTAPVATAPPGTDSPTAARPA